MKKIMFKNWKAILKIGIYIICLVWCLFLITKYAFTEYIEANSWIQDYIFPFSVLIFIISIFPLGFTITSNNDNVE